MVDVYTICLSIGPAASVLSICNHIKRCGNCYLYGMI